jgi:uncharacterized protein (DUF924 family)
MADVRPTPNCDEPTWVAEVLHFWFGELGDHHWFTSTEEIDRQMRHRFLPLYERLCARHECKPTTWRTLLARVIVMDQFSRNIFRDTGRAFEADAVARRLSRYAIEHEFDRSMNDKERYFLYLPLEHSEDRDDQTLAVKLIGSIGNENWTRYSIAHKQTIDRFGRFPHRNAILGRPSSAEEIAMLQEPGEID